MCYKTRLLFFPLWYATQCQFLLSCLHLAMCQYDLPENKQNHGNNPLPQLQQVTALSSSLLYPKILMPIIPAQGKKRAPTGQLLPFRSCYISLSSFATLWSRNGIEPLFSDLILMQWSSLHLYDQGKIKACVNIDFFCCCFGFCWFLGSFFTQSMWDVISQMF